MIVSLHALGQLLRRAPVTPTSVAALLQRHEAFLAFRAIVREIFPEDEDEIMAARESGASRETARCWAFLHQVKAELFPVFEVEEYEQLVGGIPFVPNGWSYVIWRKGQEAKCAYNTRRRSRQCLTERRLTNEGSDPRPWTD